jgi:hypothetical protein
MFETIFRIPVEFAATFVEDLIAWAKSRRVEPRLTTVTIPESSEIAKAERRCRVYVDESFFVEKPEWSPYIEH